MIIGMLDLMRGDEMKLIYATKNNAKIQHMKEMLKGTTFKVSGLNEININLKEPLEDGLTPLENAIKKAKGYYKQIKQPVYSTDSALFFEGVDDIDQPGVFIKRINVEALSGRDFQHYYMKIAKKYGGKLTAYYKNAICVVIDENTIYTHDGADICSEKFYIVDKPHSRFDAGFPLDSLSIEIESGNYYYDIKDYTSKGDMNNGFKSFFKRLEKEFN